MTPLRSTVGLCLGFIAVVVGLFVYSVVRTPVMSESELREKGVFILPRPRELSQFQLYSHTGSVFTLDDLEGRWTFAFFGFTNCPDVCPTSMSVLGQASRQIADRSTTDAALFQGLMVSVDPERDDAEALGRYVSSFSEDLTGLSGELGALAAFAREMNVHFAKVPVFDDAGTPVADRFSVDHSANIVIINPQARYHGFIKYPQQAGTIVAAFESLAANF